jgi:hypothetical protein
MYSMKFKLWYPNHFLYHIKCAKFLSNLFLMVGLYAVVETIPRDHTHYFPQVIACKAITQ